MKAIEAILLFKKTNKVFRLGLHLIFWLAYWLISYYFNTISLNIFSNTSLTWIEPIGNILNLTLLYYPFIYIVWPQFIQRRKYVTGCILFLVQILIYTTLFEIQERLFINYCKSCAAIISQIPTNANLNQPLLEGITSSFLSLGIIYVIIGRISPVITIKFLLDLLKERASAIELAKENVLLEFNFLKSQVNPHFLFNTLNNVNSLIIQNRNKEASLTVAKLSDFLRHSLYDSGNEHVQLSREIKLIQDYIELEKLRLNNTRVDVQICTNNIDVKIPPLLFIPLVENAFKYSADNLSTTSFIELFIELNNVSLKFNIRNNYNPLKRAFSGGIGLQNLKKRLENYYPEKHSLDVINTEDLYEVKIFIQYA